MLSQYCDVIKRYDRFIDSCYSEGRGYCLTPRSEVTPYATCFAIYGKHLINKLDSVERNYDLYAETLIRDINLLKQELLLRNVDLRFNKGYLQLLTFALSALSIMNKLDSYSLEDHISELIQEQMIHSLHSIGTFSGKPGTGNLAMFYGIILIYARDYLNTNTDAILDFWIDEHLKYMNRYGFWGCSSGITHLQFQNGYHQYEIFDYLGVDIPSRKKTCEYVASLADPEGHFAPYPGGGGCYDYDAVFMLTPVHTPSDSSYEQLLSLTKTTLLSEQNRDGGFGESNCIRPRRLSRLVKHILLANGPARIERLKYGLTLLRSKHNRIKTHWSRYSREWDESDLWDSWFRMMAIARIDYYAPSTQTSSRGRDDWSFIEFPGIGFKAG